MKECNRSVLIWGWGVKGHFEKMTITVSLRIELGEENSIWRQQQVQWTKAQCGKELGILGKLKGNLCQQAECAGACGQDQTGEAHWGWWQVPSEP